MAKFSRIKVINKFYNTGLVPIFYNNDLELCKEVVEACYKGGIRVFEFTNRGDFAHEIYSPLQKYVNSNFKDLVLGVGSIFDAPTASLYMQLGANFIVSPVINKEMAYICNRRKVLWVPGCGTLSEISEAESLGAEIVKIFPGGAVGGPGFIKAIKGPSPWTSIMPTGGVSPDRDNLSGWFNAGAKVVGMGSKLISKEILASRNFNELTKIVKETLNIINELKQKN